MQVEVDSLDMLSTSRAPVVTMLPAVYSTPRSAPLLALKVTLHPAQGAREVSRTLDPSAFAWSLSKLSPA